MISFFKRLFCGHYKVFFVRNLYGDEINAFDGARSLWRCDKCEAIVPSHSLHYSQTEPNSGIKEGS